jgi:UDP-N-acetylmuramoyl-tripeptide--D-alanyl-D-alanine ligase
MNLRIEIKTLANAITGKIIQGSGDMPFNSFETDTRKIKTGDFLLALKGKQYNAHDFLEETLSKGAKGWIINENELSKFKNLPECVIVVADTLKALHQLTAFHRNKFNIPLMTVTGSNGKTTVKQMIYSILSEKGPTCANKGNFNNQYGLPFSLLELNANHKFGIFELGASHKGDIAELGIIAKPQTAIITNIAPAHLEFFGDIETIYNTKTEIIEHIEKDGWLIYNADDDFLSKLKNHKGQKMSFGTNKNSDIIVSTEEESLKLLIKKTNESIIIKLPVSGFHNQMNAAAAAAATLVNGFSLETIKLGLEAFKPEPMRMQIFKSGKLTIIFDAYNANPQSMKTAIKCLKSDYPKPYYLVLGDMKELGNDSGKYHAQLGKLIAENKFDSVFLAGSEMKNTYQSALEHKSSARINYAENYLSWLSDVQAIFKTAQGTLLIKASRAMNFEKIIENIK